MENENEINEFFDTTSISKRLWLIEIIQMQKSLKKAVKKNDVKAIGQCLNFIAENLKRLSQDGSK